MPTKNPPKVESALRVAGVAKHFAAKGGGRLDVLVDVDIEVEKSGIHAVLGPSGCGKSTLLHIIAGLLPSDRGCVLVNGAEIAPSRRCDHVGYVFQDDRLLPWRTALGNVSLALEAQRLPRNECRSRAGEALAMMGLADFAAAYPAALSGGMRSRVALARSLVRRPKLLLMDEPFSRLDPLTRAAMHAEVLRLHAALGTAILLVTHDVAEALSLADGVTVLTARPGRVAARFTIDQPRPRTRADIAELARPVEKALESSDGIGGALLSGPPEDAMP